MYIDEAVDLAVSPLEFWLWAGNADGADLQAVGAAIAEGGSLRHLLRFAHPYEDRGHPIECSVEVRPQDGTGGTISVCWNAFFSRLEGQLEVVPAVAGPSRLRLTASYEPAWAASVQDRHLLQRKARDAARTALTELATAATAATPTATERVLRSSGAAGKHRVLVEDEDPAWYEFMVRMADPDEYEFASCGGPFLADGGCPLLRDEPCPKVEWADTVMHSLDRHQPANGAVLGALRRRYPDYAPTRLGGEPVTFCLTRRSPAA